MRDALQEIPVVVEQLLTQVDVLHESPGGELPDVQQVVALVEGFLGVESGLDIVLFIVLCDDKTRVEC